MRLFVDTADIEAIRYLYDYYPLDGVTTNPTILAAAKREPYAVLEDIRNFLGNEGTLHVQVISRESEKMVEEAHRICSRLGKNTCIKIPVIPEGLKAIKQLVKEGLCVTATGIYTVQQAFLAGKAGAAYAAPYVNRIDNLGVDGVQTVCRIKSCFDNCRLKTAILAASFKNSQQFLALAEKGIDSATIAPAILKGMLTNECVNKAVETFRTDFEALYGESATM